LFAWHFLSFKVFVSHKSRNIAALFLVRLICRSLHSFAFLSARFFSFVDEVSMEALKSEHDMPHRLFPRDSFFPQAHSRQKECVAPLQLFLCVQLCNPILHKSGLRSNQALKPTLLASGFLSVSVLVSSGIVILRY
jgi:hypothetical protein